MAQRIAVDVVDNSHSQTHSHLIYRMGLLSRSFNARAVALGKAALRRSFSSTAAEQHYAALGLSACSHMIDQGPYQLHVRQICETTRAEDAPVALLLHGAISNGKTFYNEKAKGLGPYLARHGFNVFVPDLRGRGGSTPSIASEASSAIHGQWESIREDIPAIVRGVAQLSGRKRQSWAAHSWGGVMMQSAMAADPELAHEHCDSLINFAVKKHISSPQSWREVWDYWVDIELGWHRLCPFLARRHGYLPAKRLGIGGDDETEAYLRETTAWVRQPNSVWVDTRDGFDYGNAYRTLAAAKPPAWHVAGAADTVRGNPRDVLEWALATGHNRPGVDQFSVLSLANGNLADYDHNSLLLSKQAPKDLHFRGCVEWMRRHAKND